MNRKTMRGMAMAAMLLCSGALLAGAQAPANGQMSGMDNAQGKSMDSMQGESPAAVYGHLMKNMSGEIISAAEAMPADKYNFVPTAGKFDGVRSFGAQVQHIAQANYEFFGGFGVGAAPDEAKMKSLKTKDELVQALKDSFAYAQKGIDTITAQNAFTQVGSGEMKMTRAGAATFCLAHAMDHYGQMVEYLRMNGMVPPASQKSGM